MKFDSAFDYEVSLNEVFCPCVYFLLRGGCVVYVGKTTQGLKRILAHADDKVFDNIKLKKVPIEELDVTEAAYIAKYDPIYNQNMPYLQSSKRIKKTLLQEYGVRVKKRDIDYWIITRGVDRVCFRGELFIHPCATLSCINYFISK
jgi:hypothetical protein